MPTTYEPIATTTLGSAAASVTFSSIPGTYTDLVLVFAGQNTTNNTNYLFLRFNGDSGSNYSGTSMRGNGSAAQSARYTNATEMYNSYGSPLNNEQQNSILQIQNYSNTTTNKTVLFRTNTAGSEVNAGVGLWRSTAAITSVLVQISANNFAAGSTITLYGIKAA